MSEPIPLLVNTETSAAPGMAQGLPAPGTGRREQAASNFTQVLSEYLKQDSDNQVLFNGGSAPVEPLVHGNALPLSSPVAAPSTVADSGTSQPSLASQTGKAASTTMPTLSGPGGQTGEATPTNSTLSGLVGQTGKAVPTIPTLTTPQPGQANQTGGDLLRPDPRGGIKPATGNPMSQQLGDQRGMQEAVPGKGLPNPIARHLNTQPVPMPVGEVPRPAQGEVTSNLFEALAGRAQIPNNNTLGHEMLPTPTTLVTAYHMSVDPQVGVSGGYSSYGTSGLSVPLGQPGWDHALGDRVQWMVNQNIQQADLRLNPPQLGSMEVSVSVKNDQTNVSFMVQHPQVREALEDAIPRLREMFNASGLTLGDVNVSQQSLPQHRHGGEGHETVIRGSAEAMNEEGTQSIELPINGTGQGLVDLYV